MTLAEAVILAKLIEASCDVSVAVWVSNLIFVLRLVLGNL